MKLPSTSWKPKDKGLLVIGYTSAYNAYGFDALLIKLDSAGTVQWHNTFDATGTKFYDLTWSGLQSSDGGFLLVGYTQSLGFKRDGYIVKTDSLGKVSWQKTISRTFDTDIRGVVETANGDFLLVGQTGGDTIVYTQALIMRMGPTGLVFWEKSYGYGSEDVLSSVAMVGNQGFVAVGASTSPVDGSVRSYLVRLDQNGDTLWTKRHGLGDFSLGNSVYQSSDKGFVVAGAGGDTVGFSLNMYLLKTDSSGAMLWQKSFGGSGDDMAYQAVPAQDDGIVLSGYTTPLGTQYIDLQILKTDNLGMVQWQHEYGNTDWQMGRTITPTHDGGYALAGYTRQDGGTEFYFDILVVKTDSLGMAPDFEHADTCVLLNQTVSIQEHATDIEISVFPNPASSSLTFRVNGMDTENLNLVLFNSIGEKIREATLEGASVQLERRNEPAGVYHYQISSERKTVHRGTLVFK